MAWGCWDNRLTNCVKPLVVPTTAAASPPFELTCFWLNLLGSMDDDFWPAGSPMRVVGTLTDGLGRWNEVLTVAC